MKKKSWLIRTLAVVLAAILGARLFPLQGFAASEWSVSQDTQIFLGKHT